MELIENPELKSIYDKCKYRVKLWEYQFKKAHGRIPSKLDIREAEREVRFAYKTYFNLKSEAIERSFVDIDGFQSEEDEKVDNSVKSDVTPASPKRDEAPVDEDVWGAHLNNKIETETKNTKVKSNVNASFSQKLFGGSKFSKRNPRKSLSLQHRKSQNQSSIETKPVFQSQGLSMDDTQNASSNDISVAQNISPSDVFSSQNDNSGDISLSQEFFDAFISQNANFKVVATKPEVTSQPLDLVQSVLNNDYKLKNSLNTGWIDRIIKTTGADKEPEQNVGDFNLSHKCTQPIERSKSDTYNYDSDDVIGNSEDESFDPGQISKKMKMDLSRSVSCPGTTVVKERCDGAKATVDLEDVTQSKMLEVNNDSINVKEVGSNNDLTSKPEKTGIFGDVIKADKTSSGTTVIKDTKKTAAKKQNAPRGKRVTRSKKSVNLKEISESEDDDVEIPKKSKKDVPKGDSPASDHYELEYSVKPRIVTVPRITKIKKSSSRKKPQNEPEFVEETNNFKPKTKRDIAKEQLEKKIASGTLNQNYVTVNIKKKVFVRGKKGMNFSKYKKQMWKNKKKTLAGPDMDMGGCDGGMLTCFNCGDVGHFARQCPKRKGDQLLSLQSLEGEDEEECPFPTLEQAEKMAEENALAVRKSNKRLMGKVDIGENLNMRETEVDEDQEEVIGSQGDDEDERCDDTDDADNDDLLLAETVRLEEFVAQLDMQSYIDNTTFVKPYFEAKEDGSIIDTPKEVIDTLKKFGYTDFRPGQETAVMRILSGKSTLVTLSTGSGKSLCYQLPAYLYSKKEPCIALVISPLVSLMEDQVTGLPPFLKAACLHTNQTKAQREKVMELVLSGSLSILLVSPEAVAAGERSSGFGSLLRKLPPISFACIDEAHCVSQWSHNFRPSYLMICRILRERLGVTTILGLTATATVSTANNIVRHLQIPDGCDGIISDVPLPDNLRLTVSKDGNRDNALAGLLLSERFARCRSVIVYCTRREECERVATFLRTVLRDEKDGGEAGNGKKRKRMNLHAEPYHAGLSASRRKSIQKSFMSGELRIVVATVAFGMGINKSDIRSVIHYNMPSSFESYVQEIGRAGRDGLPAHCHLFLDSQGNDENELRRHIHANSIDRHVIRKLLQKIFIPCSCKGACPKHEVAFSIKDTVQALDVPEENIATLLCYLELHDYRFVQVLSPAYTQCKLISYRGPIEIRKAAKECPPLAMALALHGDERTKENIFEFPVVDVASAMGWDSGICKHKLKNLEWTKVNDLPKRSTLNIEFSNLGFRLLAPGNLNDNQLDETLDYLYKRVVDQEKMCLMQLRALHTTLTSATARTYKDCLSEEIARNETILKDKIREYFNSTDPLGGYESEEIKAVVEEHVVRDTKQLVTMYKDNVFTGRTVARIFHGIQSPNYPAVIWGRCKFWRSHLKDDFHEICKIATREILKMR